MRSADESLLMYVWPGVAATWGALIAGLASAITYLRVERGRKDLLPLARITYTAFTVSVVASAAILMTLLLKHRFDVSYVHSYSSLDLPLHFLISTFWAGQEGSFLLWCFWGSLIGLFVWRSAREQEAAVMVVYLSTFLGIIAILCKQSPFKLLPAPPPADGVGLNPLLQDPWMVIHPPIMFLGLRIAFGPVLLRHRGALEKALGRLGHPRPALGALDLPHARHRDPDGRILGLQDARLGRLLGLGSGREHEPRALALHGRARPRHVPSARSQAAPQSQPGAGLHGLRRDPLRHVPHAVGRARRFLGSLLHRPRHHRLARHDPRNVHRAVDRAPRLELARDPAPRRRGASASLAQRLLHPRHRRILRTRVRHPARHLGPDPDPPRRGAVAGAEQFLRKDHDSGRLPPRPPRRSRALRGLEGRDGARSLEELAALFRGGRPPDPGGIRARSPQARHAHPSLRGLLRGRHELARCGFARWATASSAGRAGTSLTSAWAS